MAREELDACQARQPELEEHIKLLLVPADPQDSKNAILEIRGGRGGDEAAIFAGDLFRMYTKYCETKGWRIEISSVNEGAAGSYLQRYGRQCVRNIEIRIGCTPRTACSGY